ncbi:hypothetical protein B0H14DRAFT_2599293 [Mycena olivaceomarginata]|nr:hypothetical protein B0H14DRAFT_2599293 [Mycena olivaceomarginata]
MSQSPHNSRTSPPDPFHYSDKSAHLKHLILLCTPNKSGQELIRADLAACVDDQGQAIQHLKHRLVDLENGIEAPANPAGLATTAPKALRKNLPTSPPRSSSSASGDPAAKLDDDYTAELRFSSDSEIRQAQLREVIDTLPVNLEPFRKRRWLAMATAWVADAGAPATGFGKPDLSNWLGRMACAA